MGGAFGGSGKKSEAIAQASLAEQKKQYNEQLAKEKKEKATAKANAAASRMSANRAYANTMTSSLDYGVGLSGGYSLLNNEKNSTLG